MKALVTGGAGFIGSHLVDRLLSMGYEVKVVDRLSRGDRNIREHVEAGRIELHVLDLKEFEDIKPLFQGIDVVFHFAANADVRGGLEDTRRDLEENTLVTWNVLESMRLAGVKEIVFASSAAAYGDARIIPTPEDYFPIQTSFYGASKLAGEGLIQAFCEGFDMRSWMYRFVSVVGERYPHGATYDFVQKLKKDPTRMEILGDGTQRKSFLYIQDCIDSIMHGYTHGKERVNIFNIGLAEYTTVTNLANTIVDAMGLSDVSYEYTGGEKGWIGDAPMVFLSIDKIKGLGWTPKVSIDDGVRRTVAWLLENPGYYE
ncbi:MAG: NAD-dependent epimerase/dehydratase family protein [Thermoplasmata archaeon]|nr:NAD-dependent epimerase/dehydratase family protein [Thermoplasmata archaeon]